jgi:putative MATE family efflux protein
MNNRLLDAPVLPTLLRLAAPNVLAMSVSVLVAVAETWYVGRLGVPPLAAMALVFPFAMLTGMLSTGAMGGGVSSAISRALGAQALPRAQETAAHAVVIGLVAGVLYSLLFLAIGPTLFAALGGRGEVLQQAIAYATVMFGGATLIWLLNTLASVVRGTGNMVVPSVTLLAVAMLQVACGGALGLGFGPIPRLGMPGIAFGQLVATLAGTAFLGWYLLGGRGRLRLVWRGVTLRRAIFVDILRVGALACLSPLQSVLTVLIVTSLIARLGVLPLAGYGIGQRMEFMLVPMAFGVGVAAVPMVGLAIGAGDVARARRVAWTAAAVSGLGLGALGLLIAVAPMLWVDLFTHDPVVQHHARLYLQWAGPCFAFFGMGLTLYFAAQGSGRVLGPVLAATLRLLFVAGVGALLAANQAPAWSYFALVGAAMVVYGLTTAAAVKLTVWGEAATR